MDRIRLESWEELVAEELAQDPIVDDFGMDCESYEELEWYEPNGYRWELDPLSAEDWAERNKGSRVRGPALRWRHFGH
jgi:hypothetical protein